MTYPINTNIPAAANDPADDQPEMLTNFGNINSVITVDHVQPGVSTDNGKHKYVRMPATALPAGLAGEGALHTTTVSSVTNLFYRPDNTTDEYQLTRTITGSFARLGSIAQYQAGPPSLKGGWSFLPGGLLIQYGLVENAAAYSTQTAVAFPVAFTDPPISVTTTMIRSGTSNVDTIYVVPSSVTTVDFDVQNTSGSARAFYWIAIGV